MTRYAGLSAVLLLVIAFCPGNAGAAAPLDTAGLVGYWGFDGGPSDSVMDASGHGLNGTVSGNAGWETGVSGQAMVFDGSSRVTIPFNPRLALKEWTLNCWVKTLYNSDHQALISRQPPEGSPIDLRMHLSGSVGDGWGTPAGRVVPGYWNSSVPESTFAVGHTDVCDGAWHQVVGIYKPGKLLVYVDGKPDGSRIAPASPLAGDSEPLTLGASDYGQGSYFLRGSLDEVRIYDHAWSDSAVVADFGRYQRPSVPRKSLIVHYDFDQTSGAVLYDKSGNGHNGTITGAAWTAGVKGNALHFNGIDNLVRVPFSPDMNTPEFTLQAWVRTDEKTHDQAIIDRVAPGGDQWNYRLMIPSRIHEIEGHPVPPGVVQSDVRDNFTSRWDYIALGKTQVTLGKWRHIAATFKDRVFRIYVDGVLDAIRAVSIDAVTSTTQDLLLGDCAFVPIDFKFRGDMDEVSIWNYALDADTIAAMAAELRPKVHEVNLGMKSHFGTAGDTVWVPLYLSNFEADSISAAQFYLEYDPAVVTLLAVKADSGLAKGWPLLDWKQTRPDEATVAMGGGVKPLGYGEGELVRFGFRINSDAATGASSSLDLADVKFDDGGIIHATNVPGRITVSKPSVRYGDVTGNGEVDLFDAQKIIDYVVGKMALPDPDYPDFTKAVADVSGNGEITSYDAALVFQYGMGWIGRFPVEEAKAAGMPALKRGLAKAGAAGGSSLFLQAPELISGSRYRYRLAGKSLMGLLSGELAFQVADGITDIPSITSGVQGARITSVYDPAKGRLSVVLSTSDDVDEDQVDFLDIEAVHKQGVSGSGLTLVSAYLDEGRFSGAGITSKPLGSSPADGKTGARHAFLSYAGADLVVAAKAGRPLRLDVFDAQGRRVFSRSWAAAPAKASVPSRDLPQGLLWLRAWIDGAPAAAETVNLESR